MGARTGRNVTVYDLTATTHTKLLIPKPTVIYGIYVSEASTTNTQIAFIDRETNYAAGVTIPESDYKIGLLNIMHDLRIQCAVKFERGVVIEAAHKPGGEVAGEVVIVHD